MGEINVPRDEIEAIDAIDDRALASLIERCIDERRIGPVHALRLGNCGPCVATKLRMFQDAIAQYAQAKASRKLDETRNRARRAGEDLKHAVDLMRQRIRSQEEEGKRFFVYEDVLPPLQLSEKMDVRVSYRWRPDTDAEWKSGSITFAHVVNPGLDHTAQRPKRKPSAWKREQDRQDALWREWDHLRRLSLYAVAEYFRSGHDGAAIPPTYQVKTDPFDHQLNNYSCRFWQDTPPAAGIRSTRG